MNELMNFAFDGRGVRTLERDGSPWFVAKDVCDVLDYANSRDALQMLDDDEKGVASCYTLGGNQDMNIINESGLYHLIFKSNMPQAMAFRKWVTSELLPTIRKTGQYALKQRCMPIMQELSMEREWRRQLESLTRAFRAGVVSRDDIRTKLGFPPEITTSAAKHDYERLVQQ
jgi:anti-repressor protein